MMTESQTESQANPVLIAIAPNEMAAHMLQHVLDTEGIESFVFGGSAKSALFWSVLTQVRVEVRQSDYERARQVLVAFQERLDSSLPEQHMHGHCVVCGHDRAELALDADCPQCGAMASIWKINEGKFQIAGPPDAASSAFASRIGYAILICIGVMFVVALVSLFIGG